MAYGVGEIVRLKPDLLGGKSSPGREERGWESVDSEDADVLTCQGLVPERSFGLADADLLVSADDAARERHGLAEADVYADVEHLAEESAEGQKHDE